MTRWGRLPLRTQLTALFAVLLVVGLTLAGVTALTLLSRSLVAQVDAQLTAVAPLVVKEAGEWQDGGADHVLPGLSAVLSTTTGDVVTRSSGPTTAGDSLPDIPVLTVDQVVARGGKAFTVGSVGGGDRWRVLSLPLTQRGTSDLVGSVAVALPMTSMDATLAQMREALLAISLAVVLLGAAAGWWGVRRSLRPLRQIEETAEGIAEGDLSRRVPALPPTTEVGRLAGALNGMLGQIEVAFAAQSASEQRMRRFVSDASHELRTPLATIRGYGELYRMGALTTKDGVDQTIRRIEESATRMGSLVDDLLRLARLDEARRLRREPVDLVVLAGDAVADLRVLDGSRTVRLVPLTPGATLAGSVALGDEGQLRQVLANLIGNVVTHTPPGTDVELAVGRLHPESPTVLLEVRDHGPGIAPEHAGRVFERFYRADAARGRESGGAGLGMAIVAAIVEAHRGAVEIATTPGGGTTVRVVLPGASTLDTVDEDIPEEDEYSGEEDEDSPEEDESTDPRAATDGHLQAPLPESRGPRASAR
ncbi:MAG TPA: HAMP domain-containing sensor histidine kinase [Actinotalea sp.]